MLAASASRRRKLLDHLRDALCSRHYSRRTEQTYCQWVKRFIHFHNVRNPAEMAEPEINAFLTHLAVKSKVSASTQKQALCALLFLYRYVLGRDIGDLGEVVRARTPKRLPVVMTRDEVKAVVKLLNGDKWLMASVMYGAGLRLMECLRLRVEDIEFSRNEIMVRDGKGGKDRVTMLPVSLRKPLQEHLRKVKGIELDPRCFRTEIRSPERKIMRLSGLAAGQQVHDKDLADGWGRVQMPDALDCKYPNAPRTGAGNGSSRRRTGGRTQRPEKRGGIT